MNDMSFDTPIARAGTHCSKWDMLEPLYGPVRRVLPAMGGLDLAPLVVLIAVYALQIILRNNVALFL